VKRSQRNWARPQPLYVPRQFDPTQDTLKEENPVIVLPKGMVPAADTARKLRKVVLE
jgi:hypothetical protein